MDFYVKNRIYFKGRFIATTCVVIYKDVNEIDKLETYINEAKSIKILKKFDSDVEAVKFLNRRKVDILFLEIDMPNMSGFDIIEGITQKSKPNIIIVSSTAEHAVRSYEYDISDYLLKPYSYDRFYQAICKIILEKKSDRTYKNILVLSGVNHFKKIRYEDIIYIKSKGNSCEIKTKKEQIYYRIKLAELEEHLDPKQFIRINRSCMISIDKVESISKTSVKIKAFTLPIGITYRKKVKKCFDY